MQTAIDVFPLSAKARRAIFACAIGVFIAVSLVAFSGIGPTVVAWNKGDFAAFYGAGTIVASGAANDLYDPATQESIQRELFPRTSGYYFFAYPPIVAHAFSVLTRFTYQSARMIWLLASGVVLLAAISLHVTAGYRARDLEKPNVVERILAYLCFIALAPPTFMAFLAGQTTPAIFAIFLAVAILARSDSARLKVLAGALGGILLLKPQFGLPCLVLLLALRQRAIAIGVLGALFFYAIHIAIQPPVWFAWLSRASWFGLNDRNVNGFQSVSLPEVVGTLAQLESPVVLLLSLLFSIALILAGARRRDLQDPLVFTSIAALIGVGCAPHAIFYDAALALAPFLFWTRGQTQSCWGWVVLCIAASALGIFFSNYLPFSGSTLLVAYIPLKSLRFKQLEAIDKAR